MIVHIALFQWKKSVSQGQVNELMRSMADLKKVIPQIVQLNCGKNFSKWAKGYTHVVVVTLRNRADLVTYRQHSAHQPIAKPVTELEADSIGVDFEA